MFLSKFSLIFRLHWLIDIKSPQLLRDQVEMAMRAKNKERLASVIQELEEAAYPELSLELSRARDFLENIGGGRGGL